MGKYKTEMEDKIPSSTNLKSSLGKFKKWIKKLIFALIIGIIMDYL